MFDNMTVKEPDVFDLVYQLGYSYDYRFDMYFKNKECIKGDAIRQWPGDVLHYLKTGHVRNTRIFDFLSGIGPKDMGFRITKQGRFVKVRRVK